MHMKVWNAGGASLKRAWAAQTPTGLTFGYRRPASLPPLTHQTPSRACSELFWAWAAAFAAHCARGALFPSTRRALASQTIRSPGGAPSDHAFQVNGHAMAQLDPLGLDARPVPIELDPALYGFTEADFDRRVFPGDAQT